MAIGKDKIPKKSTLITLDIALKRIEGLDYLRGLMALSVMVYHYISWGSGPIGSEYLIGKLGIYAVSMFYILSGLSLGLVYYGRITSAGDVGSFIIKRIFRIFPLFWLVLTATMLASILGGKAGELDLYKVFLNYSLLFGFVDPSAYFNIGAWSIGNEMVFYAILPLVFLLSVRFVWALPLTILFSLLAGVYFAVYYLGSDRSLVEQWGTYINPFNQLFLFMGGVALGVYGKMIRVTGFVSIVILLTSFLVFCFYPVAGDSISIVTGVERFIFSFSCMAFVAGIYFLNPSFKAAPAKVLGFFGSACYSIYLLHPVVAKVVVGLAVKLGLGAAAGYTASALATLALSWLVFDYLEKPMMNAGKKVASIFARKSSVRALT
ncbi:acyltransferase [Pseudomonas bubulae]|uniref:Acyltransferase n=1 Tax=Pseudomonas bubulae TaxID=2316085 RepID=A0ABZ2H262_9PSED